MKKNGFDPILLAITLAIVVVVGYYISDYLSRTASRSLVTEDQILPEKTYTSKTLGVTFTYRNGYKILEKGNKIFINDSGDPENGEYVEVFSKDINSSLDQSVKNKILDNFPSCPVEMNMSDVLYKNPSSVYAVIKPLSTLDFSEQTTTMLKNECPYAYVKYSENNYFKMDTNNPSKFLFLHSSGQYTILVNSGPWTESVQFSN